MSRLSYRYGWMMYAGPISGGMVISGDVLDAELSMEHSIGSGPDLRANFSLPGAMLIHSRPLEQMMWEALQRWPEPGRKDGRQWPPEMKAMLELARRHPEEYADLVIRNRRIPLHFAPKTGEGSEFPHRDDPG